MFRKISQSMDISQDDTLFELGGPSEGSIPFVSLFNDVLVLNMSLRNVSHQQLGYPSNTKVILGDGSSLPLKDKCADYVLSIAVIEHVPKKQRHMVSSEVYRVAKKGIVFTTPNYFFPFEPHYLLPFFQFVPERFRRKLVVDWGLTIGHIKRDTYEEISLLTRKELKHLFPEAEVFGYGLPLIPLWWVVIRKC